MTVAPGEESPLGRLNASNAKAPSRVLRVEVNGSLHDWFDIEEMGDFVRSTAFADTLLENIARYFHVPVENQAIYDEDGLLTTSADFSRALQRVSPMLYIYDVSEMAPEMKERTVEELATINAGVEQTWKNFSNLGSNVGAPQDVDKPSKDENAFREMQRNALIADDALLSAKTQPPFGAGQPDSTFCTQPAPSAPATFGMAQDDQAESQTFQVYSLNVPTQAPESPPKVAMSTPALQLAAASDVDKTSLPTTGRTCFAAAQRNEELLAKTTTWSPQGPQVRKSSGPALVSQHTVTVQAQQQVARSPVQRLPTRAATTPTNTTPLLVGNSQSMRWQSSGLPASLAPSVAPSATAPSVPYGGLVFQAAPIEGQHLGYLSAATPGSMALDRPSSPKRAVTPPPASRRSITPPPQARHACSIETRAVTPTPKRTQTLGLDGRLLNARPPPISPAQVGARSAGLVRMASNSQLSYNLERAHSPSRAVTPPPASGRSLTPTSMAQWRGSDVHSQLLSQAQASTGPLRTSITANCGSTPVRSVTHPSCMPGSHFSALSQCRLAFGSLQPGYGSSLGASS